MKRILIFCVWLMCCLTKIQAQKIPYGLSADSFLVVVVNTDSFANPVSYNYFPIGDTVLGGIKVYYYKPLNYDSAQSPFLIGIHGQFGTGSDIITNLQAIANRRGTLIIAPVMPQSSESAAYGKWSKIRGYPQWAFGHIFKTVPLINTPCMVGAIFHFSYYHFWWPEMMKKIYRHVLTRENRNYAPAYLIGHSMGGQFVNRYMLIRQAVPDSIPLLRAASANPFYYTFCTDTFNGTPMPFPCGLRLDPPPSPPYFSITCNGNGFGCASINDTFPNCYSDTIYSAIPVTCNEHVIQYYNENYIVMAGTADTDNNGTGCALAQGTNRYERAKIFYNFSDTNAITHGTTLKWKYVEIPGVGHNEYDMFNYKADSTDTSSVAEHYLFDTLPHPVPSLAPLASFTADTTIVSLPNATVQFYNNSINAKSYLWDFGDGTTSTTTSPTYIYTYADTFTVKLTATSGTGCDNTMIKRNYIIVKNANGINQMANGNEQLALYPNPTNGKFTIYIGSGQFAKEKVEMEIYNVLGERIYSQMQISNNNQQMSIDINQQPAGIYFVELKTSKEIYHGKIIKR